MIKKKYLKRYYAKTDRGVWLIGVLTDNCIELWWQPVIKREHGQILVYDYNHKLIKTAPLSAGTSKLVELKLAGKLNFDNALLDFCGIENFARFKNRLLIHIVELAKLGYGDTLADVIDWFNYLSLDRRMIVNGDYIIDNPVDMFVGFDNCRVYVKEHDNDNNIHITLYSRLDTDIVLKTNSMVLNFIMSCKPL